MKKHKYIIILVVLISFNSLPVFAETNTTTKVEDQAKGIGEKINSYLPESVSKFLVSVVSQAEILRQGKLPKITSSKDRVKKTISEIEEIEKVSGEDFERATDKPISKVKLFFLIVLEKIFSSVLVFYTVLILLIVWILKKIYRAFRL